MKMSRLISTNIGEALISVAGGTDHKHTQNNKKLSKIMKNRIIRSEELIFYS